MSLISYTMKAIRCDIKIHRKCLDDSGSEFVGLPGQSISEVRQVAQGDGWRRGRSQLRGGLVDVCPDCAALLNRDARES